MNKSQKGTLKIVLLLIVVSVLIAPFDEYSTKIIEDRSVSAITESGWNFIWIINKSNIIEREYSSSLYETYKARFDILILEWIGIIALGVFFFILLKKT